ncbi:hypothetical protein [Streptomyces lydicus]|uniref:hypothetical protein n=1 Tax=Streptomyces lydicus TaxID=47763 RepID=UPI00101030FB|nr:hypothetical protein [Streptomyces lydicus]MCZ1006250.1 hypothetical protein [Streptomyces lydicus]
MFIHLLQTPQPAKSPVGGLSVDVEAPDREDRSEAANVSLGRHQQLETGPGTAGPSALPQTV